MSSRENILGKLRLRNLPFPDVSKLEHYQEMVPIHNKSKQAFLSMFIEKAEAASCQIHQAESPRQAIETIIELIGKDKKISSWDFGYIPVPGLAAALDAAGIQCVGQDSNVRVGLTGVDAAFAATGSLVLMSGEGRYRASSLLPTLHIAVLTVDQIMADLETWWGEQKAEGLENFRKHSNVVVVTGPSRTADIAMELVMGMHGPRVLHVVVMS